MKYIAALFTYLFLFAFQLTAQIAHNNSFPSMYVMEPETLEGELTDISFAISFRKLLVDYKGPLVRLRKNSSPPEEKDFYSANVTGIVDVKEIDSWRNGANVYVVVWYDQSGLGRNAIQPVAASQPEFFSDENLPYCKGDGINDALYINTSIRTLTNLGRDGSVLMVANVTNRNQVAFGVYERFFAKRRWAVISNWANGRLYFDPGLVNPGAIRPEFNNAASVGLWKQYTIIRDGNTNRLRLNGLDQFFQPYGNWAYPRNNKLAIFAANVESGSGVEFRDFSDISISEFIMHKMGLTSVRYIKLENDMMSFWGL